MKGLSGYDFRNVLQFNYTYDLPYKTGKGIVGHVLSGWETTGIVNIQGGEPNNLSQGVPTTLTSTFVVITPASPNAVAGCDITTGTKTPLPTGGFQYINLACFTPDGARELGNEGRNTLIGPGLIARSRSIQTFRYYRAFQSRIPAGGVQCAESGAILRTVPFVVFSLQALSTGAGPGDQYRRELTAAASVRAETALVIPGQTGHLAADFAIGEDDPKCPRRSFLR